MKKGRRGLHLALLHWPVLDRAQSVVCTNVTNYDIHDIARVSRTYGVERYYIVNRMREQLMFVSRVLDHWRVGTGSAYNPMRKTALGMVHLKETLDQVVEELRRESGQEPFVVVTSARDLAIPRIRFQQLRRDLNKSKGGPILLVFGTGFGLHDSVFELAQGVLEPLKGASEDDYRHLSVRSAVSICLDRLLGAW